MKTKILFIIIFSIFCNTKLKSQSLLPDSNSKTLVAKYLGGKKKYSKVSIKLYSDSTFEYSNWYHFGQTEKDTGKYLMTDTSLILYSKKYLASKKKNVKSCFFYGQEYRIQNKSLCLYTKKQESEDDTNFYKVYFTLKKL
jgi:hypothetical protein